ncbi:hypothetical protein JYU34_011898 [Plutella xylostella]|uniref:Uncharacterized protein n=1 Tax=Plutella xylostella TaxID=51655 RepID=A0ABQ7QEB2_PLUXY|nr:hypothetical protein JYU34_011898 [Plutella xylostella]
MKDDQVNENISNPDMSICLSETESPPQFVTQRPQRLESEDFRDFKEEIRKLLSFYGTSQKSEIVDLKSTLLEIKESNENIQSSISFLTTQNEEFRRQISLLEQNAKEDRQYILSLEEKLEDLQTGSRKTNFELKKCAKKR